MHFLPVGDGRGRIFVHVHVSVVDQSNQPELLIVVYKITELLHVLSLVNSYVSMRVSVNKVVTFKICAYI